MKIRILGIVILLILLTSTLCSCDYPLKGLFTKPTITEQTKSFQEIIQDNNRQNEEDFSKANSPSE